jgi:hypothetical protein
MVCLYCGKALSNEQSIALEAGPECAANVVAMGAAVVALQAEVSAISEAALSDDLIQRRLTWYARAMRANDMKAMAQAADSAKRLAEGFSPQGSTEDTKQVCQEGAALC